MPNQKNTACKKEKGSFSLWKESSVALVCVPEASDSCLRASCSNFLWASFLHVLKEWNVKPSSASSYKLYTKKWFIPVDYPNQHFRVCSSLHRRRASSLAETTCWPRDWADYSRARWLRLALLCSSHVNSVGQIYVHRKNLHCAFHSVYICTLCVFGTRCTVL